MSHLRVAMSPLTGTIFCGKIIKSGMWAKGKVDVTMDALVAVAEHALKLKTMTGDDVIITDIDGKTPKYKITVEKLS